MKRWPRRFGYVLIVIIWLMVMCFPTFAFTLARNGQIEVGSHLRFFMVQEENADGIGVEWTRPLPGQPSCAKTSVTYLLWENDGGQNQNVTYCQCGDPAAGAALGACEQ